MQVDFGSGLQTECSTDHKPESQLCCPAWGRAAWHQSVGCSAALCPGYDDWRQDCQLSQMTRRLVQWTHHLTPHVHFLTQWKSCFKTNNSTKKGQWLHTTRQASSSSLYQQGLLLLFSYCMQTRVGLSCYGHGDVLCCFKTSAQFRIRDFSG